MLILEKIGFNPKSMIADPPKKGHYPNDKGMIHKENIIILNKVCTQQHRFKNKILIELQREMDNTQSQWKVLIHLLKNQ